MAKRRKPKFFRHRGPNGRFLSREAIEARTREGVERLADLALLPPEVRARQEAQELRRIEVKREKEERYQRFLDNPDIYSWTRDGGRARVNRDRELIAAGVLPVPLQVTREDDVFQYVWVWQGRASIEVGALLLRLLAVKFPKDTRCYYACGSGRSKNARWIGTRLGTPSATWLHSQTLLKAQSNNTLDLVDMWEDPATWRNIWTEVKATTAKKMHFGSKKAAATPAKHGKRTVTCAVCGKKIVVNAKGLTVGKHKANGMTCPGDLVRYK